MLALISWVLLRGQLPAQELVQRSLARPPQQFSPAKFYSNPRQQSFAQLPRCSLAR
jgi:hypothetical protein